MLVIKRNGEEVEFNAEKIEVAITKANKEVSGTEKLINDEIKQIASDITDKAARMDHALTVEEIQDMVEDHINEKKHYVLGRRYAQYRFNRALLRQENTIDAPILSLLDYKNEEVKQENSNKNPQIVSTQRDYMAGEVSKDITKRYILPEDLVKAHEAGIIHIHDLDYFAQHYHNCDLVNLEDMLENGTVISNVLIEKPHSFSTGCNIMTQIMAQIASSQFGGQTMTLSHIAPFVDVSRKQIIKDLLDEWEIESIEDLNDSLKEKFNRCVEKRLNTEIRKGVQLIQYQCITLQTTNGQSPFITLFMYIDEVPEGQTRDDLVRIIKEVLEQRYIGVKNEQGIYVTPAFPKLIYVLDEDNIHEDSKYFWLTQLAAKCTARRMVPDYISAKMMKELKGENVYPCMGCVHESSEIRVTSNNYSRFNDYIMEIGQVWNNLENLGYTSQPQYTEDNPNRYIDLRNTEDEFYIFDTLKHDFVKLYGMNRNHTKEWITVKVRSLTDHNDWTNERILKCTPDHPWEIQDKGIVNARDLRLLDRVLISSDRMSNSKTYEYGYIYSIEYEKLDDYEYSYDVTTESEHFEVDGIYSHNCRSFLTVEDNVLNEDGSHKFYGRFNAGVVTINLPDVALSSGKDINKFWEIFEERLEMCHRALQYRHKQLRGTVSDVAPILWQHGALARLKKGETIDALLYNGYSTISLGYAGLYECVKYMTGKSHTDPEVTPFAMKVMQKLNDKCAEWKEAEHISYSVYGSPIESTTYKFAKCLKKRFGIIPDVTDKNYITNSYHIKVTEHINAFDKLTFEAPFQKLSPGGAISYIEAPNVENNLEAVIQIMQHIYNTILYAEINIKSDYCAKCGFTGEIQIVEDQNTGKLEWECPICKNRDHNTLSVARRTCGYVGTNFWNQGRTQEIKERFVHLDNMDYEW